jgi:hypothetical protein
MILRVSGVDTGPWIAVRGMVGVVLGRYTRGIYHQEGMMGPSSQMDVIDEI